MRLAMKASCRTGSCWTLDGKSHRELTARQLVDLFGRPCRDARSDAQHARTRPKRLCRVPDRKRQMCGPSFDDVVVMSVSCKERVYYAETRAPAAGVLRCGTRAKQAVSFAGRMKARAGSSSEMSRKGESRRSSKRLDSVDA